MAGLAGVGREWSCLNLASHHGGAQDSLAGEGGLEEVVCQERLAGGRSMGVGGRTWGWVEGVCSGWPEGPGGE